MKVLSFEEYSKNVHFYSIKTSDLLKDIFLKKRREKFNLVDLGCGDGAVLFALQKSGLLKNALNIVGVDLSPLRIANLERNIKGVIGIVSDACNIPKLENGFFDVVISSQMIEHVPNPKKLLREIQRLLKYRGVAYISSVIKKPYAFYIYRNKYGRFSLDPLHLFEFTSKEQFIKLIKSFLKPLKIRVRQTQFPIIDLILRAAAKLISLHLPQDIFFKSTILQKLRELRIPIIGYSTIEGIFCKE